MTKFCAVQCVRGKSAVGPTSDEAIGESQCVNGVGETTDDEAKRRYD